MHAVYPVWISIFFFYNFSFELQFASAEKAAQVKDFFVHRRLPPVNKMYLKDSIDQMLIRAKWVDEIQKERTLPSFINSLSQGRC